MKKYEEIHFVDTDQSVWNYSLFTDADIRNFQNGTNYRMYELLGNKQLEVNGTSGTYFAVWAPNATFLSVTGDFNNWNKESHSLKVRQDNSGIWEGFIPHIGAGQAYKYHIHGYQGIKLDKGDPYSNFWETRPKTASITWQTDYDWKDDAWMKKEKSTMRSTHHIRCMKCIWLVGCDLIKTMKNLIIHTHKLQSV